MYDDRELPVRRRAGGRPSAIATAARIESIEKAMSASSTEITVPQNPLPNRVVDSASSCRLLAGEEMRDGQVERGKGPRPP